MPIRITPVEEDLACAVIIESTTRIFLPLKFVAGNDLFFKIESQKPPVPSRAPRQEGYIKLLLTTVLFVSLSCPALSAHPLKAVFEKESTVQLSKPHDLKLSPDGRYLMVSDVGNDRIVRYSLQ